MKIRGRVKIKIKATSQVMIRFNFPSEPFIVQKEFATISLRHYAGQGERVLQIMFDRNCLFISLSLSARRRAEHPTRNVLIILINYEPVCYLRLETGLVWTSLQPVATEVLEP